MSNHDEETAAQVAEAKRILDAAGIALTVGGCRCCGSPWVRLTHNGRDVIFEEMPSGKTEARDYCEMDMHKKP